MSMNATNHVNDEFVDVKMEELHDDESHESNKLT